MAIVFQPSTKDTFINEHAPTTNYGTGATIQVFSAQPNNDYRMLLTFDVSTLPAGGSMTSATLSLYYFNVLSADPVGATVWAYKATKNDWVEGEATWAAYKTGSNWASAGGDYVTTAPVGGSTVYPASYGWINFDVTAIVQDAITNLAGIVNILIRFETEESAGTIGAYHYSNDEAVETTLRPKLAVVWNIPITATDNPKVSDTTTVTPDVSLTYSDTIIPTENLETSTDKNLWTKKIKNTTSHTNKTKNTTSYTNKSKNTTTFNNNAKH